MNADDQPAAVPHLTALAGEGVGDSRPMREHLVRLAHEVLGLVPLQQQTQREALIRFMARAGRARTTARLARACDELAPILTDLASWPAPQSGPRERDPDLPAPQNRALDPDGAEVTRALSAAWAFAAIIAGPRSETGRGIAAAACQLAAATTDVDVDEALRRFTPPDQAGT